MNDIPLGFLFATLAVMVALSAFFSGSETALMTLNRYRLQHLVKTGHPGARRADTLLQRPDRLIGLILLGNNFINIMASSLATIIAIRLVGESAIAVAAGVLTLVILVFAEVAPKTFAARHPEKLAYPASWVFLPMLKLLYPIVWVVNAIANQLLKTIGFEETPSSDNSLSKEELRTVVAEASPLIPLRYLNMLLGILDMSSATVEDIMVPRQEIIGINLDDPIEIINDQILHSPHTRLPVYKKTIDKVIGILHLRQVLIQMQKTALDKETLIRQLNDTYFVPENTPLDKQLLNFKRDQLRIGLVVDEYGDVLGLVTLTDLLEQIVGEITINSVDVSQQTDGSYLVDASIPVRELNKVIGWSLPTEGPKTLNGLIIEHMETIPEPGVSMKLLDQYPLEILDADAQSVQQVRLYPPQPADNG